MRFRYWWASPLHYIDTPDKKCKHQYSRDCYDAEGEKGKCLDGAIQNYTSQLGNKSKIYNLTEALLFLSHFMGDVHQPMHVEIQLNYTGIIERAIFIRYGME